MSNTSLSQIRLEYLFNKYYEVLCQFAYSIVKNNDAAKDIVQDFFVKYWEKYLHQGQPDNFEAYAYVSIKNRCLNYLESEQVRLRHQPGIERMFYSGDDLQPGNVENENYSIKLLKAINQLPEQRRRIFTMSAIDGLKYLEIAAQMNISINTVKTQIRKAYLFLRQHCEITSILVLASFYLGSHPFFLFNCHNTI
ncbi:RNA polymerase sigma-70 factor [Chitinophaga sp. 22321]|uniref:RNA polymerase sigma-70 factor n=1 Tax=Chitinophaga hostae TaxID=2831022 RepID=A0ABS5J8A1_9BACT|nr:RNA polymerase sigma-70 factor [Chitinophaga hostae]MBS0031433.1 RNA polymerase sigma-70 factor [Chitinophaga hostae]